ncbi:hypothetical protein [Halovivax cerinus]|uniref:Uncharacterized protein n=1 Tax=Halovivax cerinus TaxID=1487865 RepID=A0ABD5NKN2_9EURY|nr:hypothetical protein [Halovivax cerinus]
MRRRQAIKVVGGATIGGSVLSTTASAESGSYGTYQELYDRGEIDVSSRNTLVVNFVSHTEAWGLGAWSNLQDVIDHIYDDLYIPYLTGIRAIWHTWPYIYEYYDDDDKDASAQLYQEKAKYLRENSAYSHYTGPFLFQLRSEQMEDWNGLAEISGDDADPFAPENDDHPIAWAELGTDDNYTMCHEMAHCIVNDEFAGVEDDHYLADIIDRSANPPKTTMMGYEKSHFENGPNDTDEYPADHVEGDTDGDGDIEVEYDRQMQFSSYFDDAVRDTFWEYKYNN